MMEEVEAVMDGVQTEEIVLQAEDHLHAALMEDHQMVGHLHAALMEDHQMVGHLHAVLVLMEDHQVVEAVLQEQEAADLLQVAMAEATAVDPKAHHQKEEAVHQVADVDVKKVVLPTDNFSLYSAN